MKIAWNIAALFFFVAAGCICLDRMSAHAEYTPAPRVINWTCSLAVCFAYYTDNGEIISVKHGVGRGLGINVGTKPE